MLQDIPHKNLRIVEFSDFTTKELFQEGLLEMWKRRRGREV
jgi:hypothetical protein